MPVKRLYACPQHGLFIAADGKCPTCGGPGLRNWRLRGKPGAENGHRPDDPPDRAA